MREIITTANNYLWLGKSGAVSYPTNNVGNQLLWFGVSVVKTSLS
jgi:hypothetical protein